MPPRPYMLHEATYRQLLDARPNVAVLPWGATEAHNYHLPHGTDVIEAACLAERAAELAVARGAMPIVLPAIPFGNDAQQLDQVATISISTTTAMSLLRDIADSLLAQGIDRLILVNTHGGNEFKPLVRDLMRQTELFVVVVNFWQMIPAVTKQTFDDPGDHAGELETSLLLHLTPDWVQLQHAGDGRRVPFAIRGLDQPGMWTPRPWSQSHPDTGSGDPRQATAEKGRIYFNALADALSALIVSISAAVKGDLPYV